MIECLDPEAVLLETDNSLHKFHVDIWHLLKLVPKVQKTGPSWPSIPAAQEILAAPPKLKVAYAQACVERLNHLLAQNRADVNWQANQGAYVLQILLNTLLGEPLPFGAEGLKLLCKKGLELQEMDVDDYWFKAHLFVEQLSAYGEEDRDELLEELRPCLTKMRAGLSSNWCANVADEYGYGSNRAMRAITEILGRVEPRLMERGEAWADRALADLAAMEPKEKALWLLLFQHAEDAKPSKPTTKWLNRAAEILDGIGKNSFVERVNTWLPLVGRDDGFWFADRDERNERFLKGLIWFCALCEARTVVSAVGAAMHGCFKDRGRAGLRSLRAGNAAVWVLGQMSILEAPAHLACAKTRAKNGNVLKTLEKALAEIAVRLNLPPDELEELAVPDFGLENGILRREFGEWVAQIDFNSGKGEWSWHAEGKKPPKSVPASVKNDYGAALKELKTQAAEIEKLIPAHKERLDLLLREEKTWALAAWRERYLEHPFLSLLTRRLIWVWSTDSQEWHAFLPQGTWISPAGAVETPPDNAQIRLWHPIRHSADEVLAWRRLLEDNSVRQPFKQAHREIYLLTDAERTTRTYSNRFAAHIIRQHQFNALCTTRGWKNRLRLMVDDVAPPATKELPRHNLRAEFWIEGIGDNYGTDTNETGTYWRLATDQVRFYRLDAPGNLAHVAGGGYGAGYRTAPAEPLPLEEIPRLIFSEIMRDVDLFVGVASVGNDPTWNDGGPQGRFVGYWHDYSFGELSQTAQTRRDLLSRLLPKLKIAALCELQERFLRVRGTLRTYKIHLGSGNILMEPNDQYLCIVPSRDSRSEPIFLPFEGDQTLSVILSKAFLLAADDKITDATITRQIK